MTTSEDCEHSGVGRELEPKRDNSFNIRNIQNMVSKVKVSAPHPGEPITISYNIEFKFNPSCIDTCGNIRRGEWVYKDN